jgi:Tol biopolymer transport system component
VTSGEVKRLAVSGCGGEAAGAKSVACLDPAWSPDGSEIVFTRKGSTGSDLYIVNRNGTDVRRVTSTGDASHADWHL